MSRKQHIAILGAGGIGGYYGSLLARAGHAVYLLARGPNLCTLRGRGLEVRTSEAPFVVQVTASEDVTQFGSIDLAILSVKTYSLSEIAPSALFLAKQGALIFPLLNGVNASERPEPVLTSSTSRPVSRSLPSTSAPAC